MIKKCLILLLLTLLSNSEGKDAGIEYIALSLKNLSIKLQSKTHKQSAYLNSEIYSGVSGFFLDRENSDIILFGYKNRDKVEIIVEDIISALNSKDSVTCKILTPNNEDSITKNLREDLSKSDGHGESKHMVQWKQHSKPHPIEIYGVHPQSHFAKILYDADIHLKRSANGRERIKFKGFKSFKTFVKEYCQNRLKNNDGRFQPYYYSRFIMSKHKIDYLEHREIFYLKPNNFKLSTDPICLRDHKSSYNNFTSLFNENYNTILQKDDYFSSLQNISDLYELFKLMKQNKNVSLMLDSQILPKIPKAITYNLDSISSTPSLNDYFYIEATRERNNSMAAETYTYVYIFMAGEIKLNAKTNKLDILPKGENFLSNIKRVILSAKPDNDNVTWKYQPK